MKTESTEPQFESGQSEASGQGQSQGHRRRRRRRKSKAPAAPQSQQQSAPPAPQMQPPPPAFTKPVRQHQAQPKPAAPARKKKFVPKAQQAQPGNQFEQPMQPKRIMKPRQKGPREFVGPMDHSYRVSNGNIADAPPATIHVGGVANGNYYIEPYSPPPTVREDAPTRIFCFIEDLFFMAKIQETARKLGVKVQFVKADKEVLASIVEAPEDSRAKLIVFDLNNANAKPMTHIPKLKAKLKRATSIIGFLSHLQGDLKLKAIEAGCDTVMPRSAFSQSLPNLLRRYGIDEEEEYLPQPVM